MDLSGVRVHADAESRGAASSIGAHAFTVGRDIWLGPNQSSNDVGLRRAGVPGDISDTAVLDPLTGRQLAAQQDQWDKEGETDPSKRSKIDDATIDADSTSYIIDLPGGNRLMVVPDIRTDDLTRKAKDSTGPKRTNFERALEQLTHSGAKFVAWNMTHHMQSGWVAPTAAHVSTAAELVKFTEFMYKVRAIQASGRQPGQATPADVVVVSAQHELGKSMVNPAMVWLLRSLGFEVFLASSGRDVRLIEATTAGGEKIEGVAGLPYEGLRPSDPLLMQSEAAVRYLDQKWQIEDARKAPLKMKTADKSALKLDREANQARIDAARERIRWPKPSSRRRKASLRCSTSAMRCTTFWQPREGHWLTAQSVPTLQ